MNSPLATHTVALALLLSMVAMTAGGGGILVVCVAPDGHLAVELFHHEDHGRRASGAPEGKTGLGSDRHLPCTDIPLFTDADQVTRPDRVSHRFPANASLPEGPTCAALCAALSPFFSRPAADDAFRVPLASLRSIVLLI